MEPEEIMMDSFFSIEHKFLLAMRALASDQPGLVGLDGGLGLWGWSSVGAQRATKMLETRYGLPPRATEQGKKRGGAFSTPDTGSAFLSEEAKGGLQVLLQELLRGRTCLLGVWRGSLT
ncbi:UNVERIFIED_CONTAM: hypothetical protein K2H54_066260 [Gekko kuhli]